MSELVGLRLADVTLQPQASVVIHGKGRRVRCLPLWKSTAAALRAWLAVRGTCLAPELFFNARGQPMTRSVRVHPGQTCPDCREDLPVPGHQARVAARPETHVCP